MKFLFLDFIQYILEILKTLQLYLKELASLSELLRLFWIQNITTMAKLLLYRDLFKMGKTGKPYEYKVQQLIIKGGLLETNIFSHSLVWLLVGFPST